MRERTRGRRTIAIATVAAMLALAGCGAVPGLSGDERTRSEFDVDDATSTTTTPPENQYADGMTFDTDDDRFPRPEVLLGAHDESLANRSYTVEMTRIVRTDDTARYRGNWSLQYATDHDRYLQSISLREPDSNTTIDVYANGTHVWQWEATETGPEVTLVTDAGGDPVSPERTRAEIPRSRVEAILTGIEDPDVTQVPDSAVNVDATVYRITSDEFGVQSNTSNSSVAVLVTGDGRILSVEYALTYTEASGEEVRQRTTIEYADVDSTTVDAPAWVPANATNDSAETVAGPGRVVPTSASSNDPRLTAFGRPAALALAPKTE